MSVINKMLKDLDERAPEPGVQGQSVTSNYLPKQPKSSNKALLGILVVIAIALLAIAGKLFLADAEETPTTQHVSSSSITQPEEQASSAGVQTELVNSKVQTNELGNQAPNMQTPVTKTLAKAEQAEPIENAPEPPRSINNTPVPAKAEAVTPNTTEATSEVVPAVTENVVASAAEKPVVASMDESKRVNDAPEESPQPTLVIEKSNVQLTPEQRVEKLMADAQNAFDKGYISDGIDSLNQLLSMSDGHVEARNMLAAAWYGRGDLNKAVGIINDGLQRYPLVEQWRVTAAKIFFKENNAAGAFSYLERDLANASREYYSMKGNLANQLQRHDKAEIAYMRLTQIEPNIGNWWLGLALAQDNQGKHADAKTSYQNVVSKGGVSSTTMNFVQQRLMELEG